MQIVVKRTGGYAGVQNVASVDTGHLDAARARRIEQLLRDAAASLEHWQEPVGADLMRYEITVQENGTARSLNWTDDGSLRPGPVKLLIEEVQELS